MIDEVLKWADATEAKKMVDVGCGIGGSSRHISRKFGCTANGVTLSPYQANRGNELAKEQGLADKCSFQVADALDLPFPDNTFDLAWSLESGEHSESNALAPTAISMISPRSFLTPVLSKQCLISNNSSMSSFE